MSHYTDQNSSRVYVSTTPTYNLDNKVPLEILVRLQVWVSSEYKQLSSCLQTDSSGHQYLQVSRVSPHPVLGTMPSLRLVCRVTEDETLSCSLLSYNALILKEIRATLDPEENYDDLKSLLTIMNTHTTSICKGIPEEKLLTWANRKNLNQIFIERFANKVVFRERSCSYVMLDTDQADICRSCAMLLSTSSMDLLGDQELGCPVPNCGRTFKYQGALDKHVVKHELEGFLQPPVKKLKQEQEGGTNIKLEPSQEGNEAGLESGGKAQDEHEFLEKLLFDLDGVTQKKRKKRKKLKPATKDFKCSDCGKAFYFQKNLFSHVVEKHGKSINELPNLDNLKEEYDETEETKKIVKKRLTNEKGKPVVCDECGVSFKFASGLYNHRKRMHGDIEKKQCPHCEKEVKSCTLDQHIREEHGTPRFACQFCGKGFYYKSFMLNHQRLHTGDYKECVCDLCGAVYKSVQVLNRHVRNAHQDLRNHKCQHCDKAFHNKQRLERHINSQHTKARIWPCPVCHSRYDRKDNLRTHIRKNHSNVVDADTVELTAVDNDDGHLQLKGRVKAALPEPTINPETGELERSGVVVARVGSGQTSSEQQILDRHQTVHVAHDLLSLKYGEELLSLKYGGEETGQYRTLTLTSPDIKHEVIQYSTAAGGGQSSTVKIERPEIVMTGPGLGGIGRTLGRESLLRDTNTSPHVHTIQHAGGYIFPTQPHP